MTKTHAAVVVVSVVVLATVAALQRGRYRYEPKYEGQALSEWLHGPFSYYGVEASNHYAQARDAVRHLGTNAIPILLGKVQATNSTLKLRAGAWCWKLHLNPPWAYADELHQQAILGFDSLDTQDAQTAFPALMQLMPNHPDPQVRESAFKAMASTARDQVRYREILVQCAPLLPGAARRLQSLDARTAFNATNRVVK